MIGKNLIFGTQYWDLDCSIVCKNLTTGEFIQVKIGDEIKGSCFDKSGKEIYSLEGSWKDQISVKCLQSGQK